VVGFEEECVEVEPKRYELSSSTGLWWRDGEREEVGLVAVDVDATALTGVVVGWDG